MRFRLAGSAKTEVVAVAGGRETGVDVEVEVAAATEAVREADGDEDAMMTEEAGTEKEAGDAVVET